MSTVAFIRRMLDAGFTHDDALRAAEAFEATAAEIMPEPETESAGARRTRRWRERKASQTVTDRHETSQSVTPPPPLSPSPQTPLPHTPPPGVCTSREGVPARGPARTEIAKGFLAFWAAYPKRKAKDAAAKAFERAMRRIEDPDPLAVILAGIERALPGWDDPQFIPYPASWLNAGSWDDEAPTPRTGLTRDDRPNRPDKTAERHENYTRAWSGFEGSAAVLAARRDF